MKNGKNLHNAGFFPFSQFITFYRFLRYSVILPGELYNVIETLPDNF